MTDPQTETLASELARRAWQELNAIRARDGAPPGVDERYFNELVDALGELSGSRLPWPSSAAVAMERLMRREADTRLRADLTTCHGLLSGALSQIEGNGVVLIKVAQAILAEHIEKDPAQ